MFYQLAKLTRRVMAWLRPPQGVAVEPLPKLKKVKVSERKVSRAKTRKAG